MTWHKTLPLDGLREQKIHTVKLKDGKGILLVREEDKIYALEDRCSHDNAELEGGHVYEGMIECPRHGALFDVKTGEAKALPAVTGIHTYPVDIKDGIVYVEV